MGKKHFIKKQNQDDKHKKKKHKKFATKENKYKKNRTQKIKQGIALKDNEIILHSNIAGSFLILKDKVLDYILCENICSTDEKIRDEIILIRKVTQKRKKIIITNKEHFDLLTKSNKLDDDIISRVILMDASKDLCDAKINSIIYKLLPKIYVKIKSNSLELVRQKVSDAMDFNFGIINAIKTIESTDKIINTLSKRLHDWSDVFFPEISYKISGIKEFVKLILEILPDKYDISDKDNVIKRIRSEYNKMGMDYDKSLGSKTIDENSFSAISNLARKSMQMIELRNDLEHFIEKTMINNAKNLLTVSGYMVAAKLIEKAGTLKNLSKMPGSTIQVLGAESAVFRHIRTGARNPKYGILYQHAAVQKSNLKIRGKVARAVANKISIAAKIDYFKGDFLGDKLKSEIETKFGVSW